MADVKRFVYNISARNGIKTNYAREMVRDEGSARKDSYVDMKKFQLQKLNFFPLKIGEFHC